MPPISDRAYLKQEMAKRELARKSYRWYLYYVHGQQWRRTKMSDFLANTVHMPGSLTTLAWASGVLAASSLNDYAEPADEKQLLDIYAGNARVQR